MKNPAAHIKDKKQLQTLSTLKDVFGDGTLYTMEYTADYRLDTMMKTDHGSFEAFKDVLTKLLIADYKPDMSFGAGCSAFCAKDRRGHVLVGRNFDFRHEEINLMIRTDCGKGYKAMGMTDPVFFGYGTGSLTDGKTDISSMIVSPYMTLDGVNEKGLFICVLMLANANTSQDTGKTKVFTTSMMRAVLDRAANVEEAEKVFRSYDMSSTFDGSDYHFFVADANGESRVFEYVSNELYVHDMPLVTNFYVTPGMRRKGGGKARYDVLNAILKYREGKMEKAEVMAALRLVQQPAGQYGPGNTMYSAVYDLTERSVTIVSARRHSKPVSFKL